MSIWKDIAKVERGLRRTSRLAADVRSVRSPETAGRRVVNKVVGRALGRAGVWRRLWR